MPRWWFLCLVACGRVNFEPQQDGASDAPADVASFACPATYTTAGGTGCYRVVKDSVVASWEANELVCEADAPTGHLAVIDDHAELIALTELLIASNVEDAAVGFSDRLVEGEFRTVTGAPLFLELGAGEPDGGADVNCGGLDSTVASFGMEDILCSNANDFICEVDGRPADPSTF